MQQAKSHMMALKRVRNTEETRLGYLRLDKNENILPWPSQIRTELKKALSEDFCSSYPELGTLYQKLAKLLKCRPENIFLTAGSDAAIKAVFEVFINPGDEIILLSPSYAMFNVYAAMFQARLTEYFYRNDLTLDVEGLKNKIRSNKPKLVCIANPNSPTGTVIEDKDLREIIGICKEAGSIVLIDEAYYMFYDKTVADLINQCDDLVITRTFSKAFGMASARLGYNLGSPKMVEALYKTRPMYEANFYAVKFAEILIDRFSYVKASLKKAFAGKKYLEAQLKKLKLPFYKSYANFINIDVGSKQRVDQIAGELKKKKILVKTGFSHPPLDRCIRANIGNQAQMKHFIDQLKKVI